MNKTVLGHCFCVIVVLFWGMTFVSSKVLLKHFSPVEILFDRFILATFVLALFRPKALRFVSLKTEFFAMLVGLYGVTLYFVFENNALIYSNASNVCLIVSTTPLFVALFNRFVSSKVKFNINFYLGFVIAMMGIGILSFGSFTLRLNPLGDLLALGAAVVWGLYNLYVCKLSDSGLSTLDITIKSFFYSLLLTVPLMLSEGYEIKADRLLEPINMLNYMFLALVASSLSFYIWNKAIEYIGAVKTNLYIYATPVVTAAGAVICIDESITVYTLMGMVLALGGLLISQKGTTNQ
ncbi:MAG: DMT family transporter [Succinivibrio sp.]|jgi:drug/metabolite transporter (DMT)-like permease|nr:DMT family transporter [Succinivibrio sp.]